MNDVVDRVIEKARQVAKAIAAGVGAAAAFLLGVVSENDGVWEAVASLNAPQVLGLVIAVLGSYGITWKVTNLPAD